MTKSTAPRPPRPSREALLEFIRDNPGQAGKREIARAFGLKTNDRVWLRDTLRDMAREGLIEGGRSSRRGRPGLPPVSVLEVTGIDADGDLLAAPATWTQAGPRPTVRVTGSPRDLAAAIGDRVLAKVRRSGPTYEGRILRHLPSQPSQVLGVIDDSGREIRLLPVNRRVRTEFVVEDAGGAQPGEVVVADVVPGNAYGLARIRVRERIGALEDASTLSLTAIHEHGLPTTFSSDAMHEADSARVPSLEGRTDLRHIPFVTIDPETARDFDDAVWAEPDPDPKSSGGWIVRVAIADVAHYLAPGSALDRDAKERGNSTYFPDRVVPMLPEALSAELCSLEADKDRACMAVTLWLDAEGKTVRHRFERGLMRSVRRLTYAEAQQIREDGGSGEIDTLLANLYGAHRTLAKARAQREPLEIQTPELDVRLAANGHVASVHRVQFLEAHKLIEDLMIAANVAAAEVLSEAGAPCMYRVHDEPERERIETLRDFLDSLGIRLARGQRLTPGQFNGVLRKVADRPNQQAVNQAVLRTQAQAEYSAAAAPHFGLNLPRYVHFTSPIRRYADLLIHRGLISVLGLGSDGLGPRDADTFAATAQHISMTERRAVAAERDALSRFLAAYLSDHLGAVFPGRISGVINSGVFVTLDETGADGLVPMRSLGDDFYHWDEARHRIIGERTHHVYRLGDAVEARIVEAVPATGGLLLELVSGGSVDPSASVPRVPRRRPQHQRRRR